MTTRTTTALLLLLGLLAQTAAARAEHDFSAYPKAALPCLWRAADSSGCEGDTGAELNDCLCYDGGGFVMETARCVGSDTPDDLVAVYRQMRANCRGTGDTLSVSEEDFLKAGGGDTTTGTTDGTATATDSDTPTGTSTDGGSISATTTAPTTATSAGASATDTRTTLRTTGAPASTPSSSATDAPGAALPTEAPGTGDLSTGAKAGIGVGAGVGAIATVFAVWFFWVSHVSPTPSSRPRSFGGRVVVSSYMAPLVFKNC